MPPKVYLALPQHHGDFRAMPAYVDGAAGVKWVELSSRESSAPRSPFGAGALHFRAIPKPRAPFAIMDGTLLTAVRTGAAAAVASKSWRNGARARLASSGAVCSRATFSRRIGSFTAVSTFARSTSRPKRRIAFAQEAGGVTVSVEQAAGCDIVCTATPSRAPIIDRGWVRPGTHINALGADAPGKQELDPRLFRRQGRHRRLGASDRKRRGECRPAPRRLPRANKSTPPSEK